MQLETLRKDMVAAMKAKDKVTKEAVSSLIAAAKKVAIDEGCRDDIPEELVDLSLIHIWALPMLSEKRNIWYTAQKILRKRQAI